MRIFTLSIFIITTSSLLSVAQPTQQSLRFTESLRFEENKGQIANTQGKPQSDIVYILKDHNVILFFRKNGISFQWNRMEKQSFQSEISEASGESIGGDNLNPTYNLIHTYRTDLTWVGSNTDTHILPSQPFDSFNNYYYSHCPEGILAVKSFEKITYTNIYKNIDLIYYIRNNQLKYDLILHPGANLSDIQFAYTDNITEFENGKISIQHPFGSLEESGLIGIQNDDTVNMVYSQNGNKFSFSIADGERYLQDKELIIDPVFHWGTYYGGSGEDKALVTASRTTGAFLAGVTESNSNIADMGQTSYGGSGDGFLVRFNALGTRQWATYYGGTNEDEFNSIAFDEFDNSTYVGGWSGSSGIATPGTYSNFINGDYDALLVKFSTSGTRIWATYYGGPSFEFGRALSVNQNGDVYFAGESWSSAGVASSNAIQPNYGGGQNDGFIVKFNSLGERYWATYFGGVAKDYIYGICTNQDNIYITGNTTSNNLTIKDGHQSDFGGQEEAFVSKLDKDGNLVWSSFYGGTGNEWGKGISYSNGFVYVAGYTTSTSGIASGEMQNSLSGTQDAFLIKFNETGTRQWGTYFGGPDVEKCNSIAVINNSIYIAGNTLSATGISFNGAQVSLGGKTDGFLTKFNSDGVIIWSTYLGGSNDDYTYSVAVASDKNVYLCGETNSSDGVASGAHQNDKGGGIDGFMVRYLEFPTPVIQASEITFSSYTENSVVVTYKNGDGASRILVARKDSEVNSEPVDGQSYFANSVMGNGADLGNGNFVVHTGSSPVTVTGLVNGATYHFRLFEYNESAGDAYYYNTTSFRNPASTIIDNTGVQITADLTPSIITEGTSALVKVQLSDDQSGISSAHIEYRSISKGGNFQELSLQLNGQNWETLIPADALVDLGVEYRIKALNNIQLQSTSDLNLIRIRKESFEIPYSNFGSGIGNYKMISIPLELDKKTVSEVFGQELGNLDKYNWRLYQYTNNTKTELSDNSTIIPGKGYWLIAKNNPSTKIISDQGSTVTATSDNPFEITLHPGWNLIGNPYPFNIGWQDLLDLNPSFSNQNSSYQFQVFEDGAYKTQSVLSVGHGAFVEWKDQTPGTLKIPVLNKNLVGGRISNNIHQKTTSIDNASWQINFNLTQNGINNSFGGLGMSPEALHGIDPFDNLVLPRFGEYLELNHRIKFAGHHLAKNMVPISENYTWPITIESSLSNDPILIRWDSIQCNTNKQLYLVDETNQMVVNMKSILRYEASPHSSLRILFGNTEFIKKELPEFNPKITSVYPNPVDYMTNIELYMPSENKTYPIIIEVLNVNGEPVCSLFNGEINSGFHSLKWNGTDYQGVKLSTGLYIIKMKSPINISTYKLTLR